MLKFRKIIFLFVMVISLIAATAFSVSAQDGSAEGEEIITQTPETDAAEDAPTEDVQQTLPDSPQEDGKTIFSRLYEFATENAETILGFLSVGTSGAVLMFFRKKGNVLISGILKMLAGQTGATDAAKNAEAATADMVEKQGQMDARLGEMEAASTERDKVTRALLYEIMTLVQMQHTLALNNANIPQAIKNYTTSLCANCLAAVENDEELKKAYEEMRGILGISKKEGAKNEEEAT